MSEVQETGTDREYEQIQKPQASSSKTRKVYVLGVAFVAVLLLGASFGMMLSATTPTGFPTVIEPGSNVGNADYVLFNDGASCYAKNGTSGAIEFSGTSFYTVINSVIAALPTSGVIILRLGTYTLSSTLVIDDPGITIEGTASSGFKYETKTTITTTIVGSISIQAENVKLTRLNVNGDVEIAATASGDNAAHWITLSEVWIYGQYRFVGTIDIAISVPLNVNFEKGGIQPVTGDAVFFNNSGGTINQITFSHAFIEMQHSGNIVKVITSTPGGQVSDVAFLNCVLSAYHTGLTIFNFTGNNTISGWIIDNCYFEVGNSGVILFYVAASLTTTQIDVSVSNCHFVNAASYAAIVYDETTGYRDKHSIRFSSCDFWSSSTLAFYAYSQAPGIVIWFNNCMLRPSVTLSALNPQQKGIANFINCQNLNPIGNLTQKFHNGDGQSISLNPLGNNYPVWNIYYTVYDVGVWITSTGGTGISITIRDSNSNVILTGVSTLDRTFLPIGYSIKWVMSTLPDIVIDGE